MITPDFRPNVDSIVVDSAGAIADKADRLEELKASVCEWHAELVSILQDISDGASVGIITARLTGVVIDLAKHKHKEEI